MIKEREAAEAEVPAHKQQWQGPYEDWQAGGFQGHGPRTDTGRQIRPGFSRDVEGNVTISDGSFPSPGRRFVNQGTRHVGRTG